MKSVVLILLTLKCYVNLLSWGRNAEEQVSHYAAWEWGNEEHRICATNAVKTPNKIWNVSVAYNETNHLLKPTQNSTTMFYGDVKITVNMIVTVPRWAYQFSLRIALNIFVLVLRIWLVNQDNIPSRAMISFILIICSVKYRYTEEKWYFHHSWDWSEYVFQNLSIMLPLHARFQITASKCEEIETGRGSNFIRCLTRLYLPSREENLEKMQL